MKSLLKLSILSLIMINVSTHAALPRPGWYGGLFIGGSYAPQTDFHYINPFTQTSQAGKLTYSPLVNGGAQVGYRVLDHLRVEAELFINYNKFNQLTLGNMTFKSNNAATPSNANAFQGSTTTVALMANLFYDIYAAGTDFHFSPYVGAGIGYAEVVNGIKLYNIAGIPGLNTQSTVKNAVPAAQGIVGLGYFLDDFTWFGLDFRYLSTQSIALTGSPVKFATLNFSFNSAFNCA